MDTKKEAMQNGSNGLDRIANYIKKLKFKKVVMGGIEPEGAYQAMRELVSIFTDIYTEQENQNADLERRLQSALLNQGGDTERLQELKAQVEARLDALKAENDSLRSQLADAGNNPELEELRQANQALTAELEDSRNALEEKQQALENSRATVESLRSQLLEVRNTAAADHADLTRQLSEAQQKAEAQLAQSVNDSAMQTKLALAEQQILNFRREKEELAAQLRDAQAQMKESSFRNETLEEVYLDANRRRREIIENANVKAEEIIKAAEADAIIQKDNADAEIKETRARFAQELQVLEGERDALSGKIASEMEALHNRIAAEESAAEAHCKEMLEQTQIQNEEAVMAAEDRAETIRAEAIAKHDEMIEQARVESDQIIEKANEDAEAVRKEAQNVMCMAQATYKQERKKYDALLSRLGELRKETLRSIQDNINQFQTLSFNLTNSGISMDTEHLTSAEALSDDEKMRLQ